MALLLSIIKLSPILIGWVEDFIAYYVEIQKESIRADVRKKIEIALIEHNQIPVEIAIGSNVAGKPSGLGTIKDKVKGI